MSVAALLAAAAQNRESWKYTSLQALRALPLTAAMPAQIMPAQLPPLLDAQAQRLVFVNGIYQPTLSATQNLPAEFLNGDAARGYQLTVQAETCLATVPLELLCVVTAGTTAQESALSLQIHLGAHARLTLLERHIALGQGAAHAATQQTRITLAAQAKLLHGKFQQLAAQDYHLAETTATLAKGAYYDQFSLTTGAALSRHTLAVTLQAPEAQTRLHGATLLHGAQHSDSTVLVRHAAPQTSSQQHYRSVLDGKARGVFQGKIIVAPDAQQTDGRQMSRALLLSDLAEANSKPELEIYADNVQCSHGATIGQLDTNALFYLRTRGIPLVQARALLISAFMTELIEQISAEPARRAAQSQIDAWYEEAHT